MASKSARIASLKRVTAAVVAATGAPVFVKLSSTLADLGGAAVAAIESGATGLTLINTVGPALAAVGRHPILSNRLVGLSGDGIRPMGLRAVEQARQLERTRTSDGRIASPEHGQ
jgi:dihydroorotate dehydrogenase (NAD+) catalytic subunit